MNKKIIMILVILIGVAAVFAYLNTGDQEERLASQREAKIFIVFEEKQHTVDFEKILSFEQHTFEAMLKSSGGVDVNNIYTGIRLQDLLAAYEIPLTDITQVITKAADGYTVALSPAEVLEEDNVYIVYKVNGEALSSKEEGGSGPYQLVIRQDPFAQRWNKFLMTLEVR